MSIENITVPDIGDFDEVEVIDVLVSANDTVSEEDPLITLESDKASMDVPAPMGGTIKELNIKVGDKVSKGSLILKLEVSGKIKADRKQPDKSPITQQARQDSSRQSSGSDQKSAIKQGKSSSADLHAEVLVLGAGPGGYTAAFRAADLGKQVVLVERYARLGGVCLNVGCIPSKALLHVAQVIEETKSMKSHGIDFGGHPKIDRSKLLDWKNSVVNRLTSGLQSLASERKVTVVTGSGQFISPKELEVVTEKGKQVISFDKAIIAAGSQAIKLPQIPADNERVLDSTSALELPELSGDLLVVGGGIIALEMATVYHALGVKVTVAVRSANLLSGLDKDLVRPLQKRITRLYENIHFNTEVDNIKKNGKKITVQFKGEGAPASRQFDYILVATGRRPNGDKIGCDKAGVKLDNRGFITVDKQLRTSVPHIFAIGDIVGDPLLAHKASHQGKIAAEVAAGENSAFDVRTVPSVAYTDPEIAWAGVTETEAKNRGIDYGKGTFPWNANGRALSLGRDDGLTKILFDKHSGRIIGVGITGPNASELLAEGVLAIEMGADASDLALSIHPHPTLTETMMMAAEVFEGTITDLYVPKK